MEFEPRIRVLLIHLCMANREGVHFNRREKLAALAGFSRQRFKQVEDELVAMGLIKIESRGGPGKGANRYRVTPFVQALNVSSGPSPSLAQGLLGRSLKAEPGKAPIYPHAELAHVYGDFIAERAKKKRAAKETAKRRRRVGRRSRVRKRGK